MKADIIDTHTHLYLDAFKDDLDEVVDRAIKQGVSRMLLPNLDSGSIPDMMNIVNAYPGHFYPMLGLHPTSVKENFAEELEFIGKKLKEIKVVAIGEIGIDLYWDKQYLQQQVEAFTEQLRWAKKRRLPVVIHARDSFEEIFKIMDAENNDELTGVFHSFTGNKKQAAKALSYGFYIGINGILTFKNSGLAEVLSEIPRNRLLLETDAPFLAPHPYRGKRNESAYLLEIAKKVADILEIDVNEVAEFTSNNARNLFNIE